MIPRYAPTYEWSDLAASVRDLVGQDATDELAHRLAEHHGVRHAFLLDTARAGIYAVLEAYGRPGRVLLPAYDCIVVPEAIRFAGYIPEFVDVDPATLQMTAAGVEKAFSGRVTVVMPTHLFGIPCEVREICALARRGGALVLEDAAPALGATVDGQRVGSFGDAAVISFQSTKVISGEGGGAVLTDDDDLAHRIRGVLQRTARRRGGARAIAQALARKAATHPATYAATRAAYGYLAGERMFDVVRPAAAMPAQFLSPCRAQSSALVLRQWSRLAWNLDRRRSIAARYQQALANVAFAEAVTVPRGCAPAWIQFPIRVADKAAFYRHMQRAGVDVTWTYRYSCADSYGNDICPNARTAANTVLGLPTYPALTDAQAQRVCEAARSAAGGRKGSSSFEAVSAA